MPPPAPLAEAAREFTAARPDWDDRHEPESASLGFGIGLDLPGGEAPPARRMAEPRAPEAPPGAARAGQRSERERAARPAAPQGAAAADAAGDAGGDAAGDAHGDAGEFAGAGEPDGGFQGEAGAAQPGPGGPNGSAGNAPAPGERRLSRRERWKQRRDEFRRRREERRAQHQAAAAAGGAGVAPPAREGAPNPGQGTPRQDRAPRGHEGRGSFQQRGGAERGGAGHEPQPAAELEAVEGMVLVEKSLHGHLRLLANQFLPQRDDPHIAPRLVQRFQLRDGSLVRGRVLRGQGPHRFELVQLDEVDGRPAGELKQTPVFKRLVSVDPDFHYAVGDVSGDVNLRIVDLICPIGRGQRGLIVAPPRTGKTILLQKLALAMQEHYSDVTVMVLLVDERPEEATEWRRVIKNGHVFVSTNDELAQNHVELAEAVWARCCRMVELGQDVFLVIDSITRLARAYNNTIGGDGRTMSGGIDTRTMERPKQFFGSARNTETAGSLTILATCLIETGSRMDQVIFEEFKGTGNMELVLSRKLADRRIFPAIDIQKSGTRKDEKLFGARRLKLINTLRRVLNRMNFIEAMELLVAKLEDVKTNDEFLARFEVDPEA